MFPILQTEKYRLRELRIEDAGDLFDYFCKDEVTEYYDLESFTEIGQAENLIHTWKLRFSKEEGLRWAITCKNDDRLIGTCGFHNWSKEHYKAEIGYELAPEHWRKGIMTEVLNEIKHFGFNTLGLNRIEAFIDPHNISSRRLLEKCRFKEEGTLKDYFYEKNRFVDAVIFASLKRDS